MSSIAELDAHIAELDARIKFLERYSVQRTSNWRADRSCLENIGDQLASAKSKLASAKSERTRLEKKQEKLLNPPIGWFTVLRRFFRH